MPLNSSHAPETIPTHPVAKDCKPLFREGSTVLTARMAFVMTGNWLVFPPNLCFLGRKQRRKRESEKKGGKGNQNWGPLTSGKYPVSHLGIQLPDGDSGLRSTRMTNWDRRLSTPDTDSPVPQIRLTEGRR